MNDKSHTLLGRMPLAVLLPKLGEVGSLARIQQRLIEQEGEREDESGLFVSKAEGPVVSEVEGPALSSVEGEMRRVIREWLAEHEG